MRIFEFLTVFVFTFLLLSGPAAIAQAPVCHSLTAGNLSYSQDFNSLASTGTSSSVPGGFGFVESGTSANLEYAAGNGSSSTGNTYSYGATGASERALGGLQSGSVVPTIGACFTNNTGSTISSIQINYDGEQWRLGNLGRLDKLDFQYSLNATSLTTGTWVDVDALDFIAPNTTTAGGILDGNATGNRTDDITSTLSSLNIPTGGTIYIRWNSFDAINSDDGLAVDDFGLTASIATTAAEASIAGRVTDENGRGIRNVRVSISGGDLAEPVYAVTTSFGYFRVDGLDAGETYVVRVSGKRYNFADPVRVVSLGEDALSVDFTAEPR